VVYLTGAFRREQAPALVALGMGVMLQPGTYAPEAIEAQGWLAWAADNGCFSQGDTFNLAAYYRWLERVPRSRLLFATAPDVLADAEATLTRSLPVLKELERIGLPRAFVAQDGSESGDLIPWDDLDCLFLGGTTDWKLGAGARQLSAEAKRRDKWVHMGRVNSSRRLRYATTIGCDSADGTILKYRNRDGDGVATIAWWFDQRMLSL
jgi:hypothetical protein